jgi:hypothetical protein
VAVTEDGAHRASASRQGRARGIRNTRGRESLAPPLSGSITRSWIQRRWRSDDDDSRKPRPGVRLGGAIAWTSTGSTPYSRSTLRNSRRPGTSGTRSSLSYPRGFVMRTTGMSSASTSGMLTMLSPHLGGRCREQRALDDLSLVQPRCGLGQVYGAARRFVHVLSECRAPGCRCAAASPYAQTAVLTKMYSGRHIAEKKCPQVPASWAD